MSQHRKEILVLATFAVVFIALAVASYSQKSATWDEPQHVTAGYAALHDHDYRTDPEHPPFLRMWAALPLLLQSNIRGDFAAIDRIAPKDWVAFRQFEFCHVFLYRLNDADRLLYAARFMNVLLGVLLGVLVFAWARDWLGFWPATAALAFYTFEPNILAHSSLVTTDLGIALFMFGTLYFLWRVTRQLTAGNLAGLTGFFALAAVSKFTSVMLVPVVLVLLVARSCRKSPWNGITTRTGRLGVSLAIVAGLLVVAWGALWAVYEFRYAPSNVPGWLFDFSQGSPFGRRIPVFARLAIWADQHRLVPNACSQGFLLGQIKAQARSAFLAGDFSTSGWWYYFPVAFLIKTPLAVLVLLAIGLGVTCANWRQLLVTPVFLLVPPLVIVGLSMTQRLNIGLRHILPVYPLVLVLCASAAHWLFACRKRVAQAGLVAVGVLAVAEFARVYPHPLAFFNSFVGGPRNGYKYLVDSNLDWGQDLKGLKLWMDRHDVRTINLAYFGTADPAYYGINCVHLPGAPFFAMEFVRPPVLPGYVAVSATPLAGVYFDESFRDFYRPLREQEPLARIGYSIHVYRVEQPWWQR